MLNKYLDIKPEVAEALAAGKPVVALESTIISHGMPYPQNVETALAVEKIIRENGAVPATIAIIFRGFAYVTELYSKFTVFFRFERTHTHTHANMAAQCQYCI